MKQLAIITSHPIQYNAPVFRLLAERGNIRIKVFYTWENSRQGIYDKKFGKEIKWDIPLLEGYEYEFVKNVSKDQGTHHFNGMINPGLNKVIEDWGADAILVYGWNFRSHFRAMRHFKGKIPVYFRGDSTLLDEKPGIRKIIRYIWLRLVYSYIDYAFYVGENNKKYFLKYGLKDKNLVFAPHAIDNKRFSDPLGIYENKALQWRKDLDITENHLVFLYAGKFEPKKDPAIFLDAASQLRNENLKFVIAGDGMLKDNLMDQAKNNPNIIFIPFQNQSLMPVLYRLCHVFVMPSKGPGETWGLAVNEAMACQKAVLVSDKTGCSVDLVKDNYNGYIFKSGDIGDLTEKISQFNHKNCIEFGKNSWRLIQDYSFENLSYSIENKIQPAFGNQ